jgi:hypothetical protein
MKEQAKTWEYEEFSKSFRNFIFSMEMERACVVVGIVVCHVISLQGKPLHPYSQCESCYEAVNMTAKIENCTKEEQRSKIFFWEKKMYQVEKSNPVRTAGNKRWMSRKSVTVNSRMSSCPQPSLSVRLSNIHSAISTEHGSIKCPHCTRSSYKFIRRAHGRISIYGFWSRD